MTNSLPETPTIEIRCEGSNPCLVSPFRPRRGHHGEMELIRDRYETIDLAARGGQGSVLRAVDRVHDRTVAIKVRPADPGVLAEARLLLNLRAHRALPLVREDFVDGDRYCLVMDWIDGEALSAIIDRRGPMPLDEVLPWLADVAAALDHLHASGVIHRDVKPANIIVTESGNAVLVDLGIGVSDPGSADRAGTRGYSAPEVAAGSGLSAATDVFGLAATAFASLTGAPPQAGTAPAWNTVPPERVVEIEAAFGRALALDPARRYESAGAFVDALQPGSVAPNNLPLQLTSLVGRDEAVAEVRRLLGAVRVVTLTGQGGIGKTRLALATARDEMERFTDGAWFVDLSDVHDATLVPQAVASALRVRESPEGFRDALLDHLMTRRVLLVLDNCEHVLEQCAALAAELLRVCSGLTVLATSREALGIGGETTWRVPALALPEAGDVSSAASAQLFAERARLVHRGFTIDQQNSEAIAMICRRLDGMPLAIELAAARANTLSAPEIASRLDDRFRLLTTTKSGAPDRQRSLRAVVDWSYELLDARERALLRRSAVFRGGWTLEAAEEVCAGGDIGSQDILDALGQLVDKSLVASEIREHRTRYRMLETVRHYATELLDSSPENGPLRARHRDWTLAFAERAERGLEGAEQAAWMKALQAEHDNIRAALSFAIEEPDGSHAASRIAAAVWRFWDIRGYLSEGQAWLDRAIAADADAPASVRARALRAAGRLALERGDPIAARALGEASMVAARESGDDRLIALSLSGLAIAAGSQSDFTAERVLYEECLAIWRRVGNVRGVAVTLGNLGTSAYEQGELDAAQTFLRESLALRRELSDRQGVASALNSLGLVAGAMGDQGTQRALFDECLATWRELGYKRGVAVVLLNIGASAVARGDATEAAARLDESVAMLREMGIRQDLAEALNALGTVRLAEGDRVAAATLHREALDLRWALGDRRGIAECFEAIGVVCIADNDHRIGATLIAAGAGLRAILGTPIPADRRGPVERAMETASLDQEIEELSLEDALTLARRATDARIAK